MPFFYYKNKRFCYLWIDKKLLQPYIGIVDGKLIDYPGLLHGTRSRMKTYLLDPSKDLPIKKLDGLMKKVLKLYK